MKKCIFIVIFFSLFTFHISLTYAQQNLVPNYSFEQKLQCVTSEDQFIGYVADWTGQGGNGEGLSWLTAQCNSFSRAGVPDNYWGYQYARTGNSYAGITSFLSSYADYPYYSNFRNYIQVQLMRSLTAGTKYCVVWYVSLADTAKYACNDMGAYFSDSALYNDPLYCAVKSYFTPQVANDPVNNPLTNKVNWTKITGSFVASGGEQYIVIGNFKDDSTSSIDSVGSTASMIIIPSSATAFYYVDDVSVLEVMQAHAGRDTLICMGGQALIGKDSAVPGVSYSWSPATGLTNPDAAQTFASPTVTTTYTLTEINDSMENRSCGCPDSVTTDSITVSVYTITACCPSTISIGQSVALHATPAYKYLWLPNTELTNDTAQSFTVSPALTTTYTITGTNSAGCIAKDSVTIAINPETCGEVFVPTAFSPNGEYNNMLYVRSPCIAKMEFMVFDRWGNKVFESNNLNNGWNGEHNGQPLGTGTYVWYLNATLLDGTSIEKKGNVTLVR